MPLSDSVAVWLTPVVMLVAAAPLPNVADEPRSAPWNLADGAAVTGGLRWPS
jgi:hypothetical protein